MRHADLTFLFNDYETEFWFTGSGFRLSGNFLLKLVKPNNLVQKGEKNILKIVKDNLQIILMDLINNIINIARLVYFVINGSIHFFKQVHFLID